MVMTKSELIGSLRNEVRILLHLVSKIDPAKLDYRPTAKQRSTLDLLRYLSMMGPAIIEHAKDGKFDAERWGQAETAAMAQSFDRRSRGSRSKRRSMNACSRAFPTLTCGPP